MGKSTASGNDTLTYWLTTDVPAVTRPTTWFMALFTGDPLVDGSGPEVDPVAEDTSYARQPVTFGIPVSKAISNDAGVDFATVTLISSYTITHFAIYDAVTAGNLLFSGKLVVSRTVLNADIIQFAVGDIAIEEV